MKHIDYLYFNIYSYFYRLSLYRQSFNVRIQAMYLFSIGSGGWLLMLESIYLHFIKHSRFASRGASAVFAVSLYALTGMLFHYIFIIKDRDQEIFGKYEDHLSEENPRQRLHFILSMSVLLLPYVAMAVFGLFFPRHGR